MKIKEKQKLTKEWFVKLQNIICNNIEQLEKKDIVVFGSTVFLVDLEVNQKKTYKIVGKDEADIKKIIFILDHL